MEMDSQERESEIGEESPVSHNDEDMSDAGDHDDVDSCDEMRRHAGLLADHGDVLAKLKMQVRDIKVGVSNHQSFYQDDYETSRNLSFPMNNRPMPSQENNFQLPVPFPFPHPAAAFLPPMAPQPAAPSSGSSHSSEGSASSQHTWSFEEQFKQVRQLYEINDDPKRKEFLDDLFSFMQKRGSPINRLPIMAKSVLDLYELYNLVIARGGLVDVINKKLWQEIIKGLHLPSSITSAAFTLRTQYMKYLYPYECDRKRLSTPAELQAAIDGNRREGRRTTYGQYENVQRSPNHTLHMNPMTLVTQQHQQQLAARMLGGGMNITNGHPPSHQQPLGQHLNGGPIPGLAPSDVESRVKEYMKLFQQKDVAPAIPTMPSRPGDVSPPNNTSVLNNLEMTRITLWNLYNNNHHHNNHHQNNPVEPQKEPINLSESSSQSSTVKREPDHRESPPPPKRLLKEEEEAELPLTPKSSPTSTHIKINSRGDSRNGDNSLVVSMEINGVTYQGVLFAQNTNSSGTRTALAS
ncbi:retained isoform X3 [Leptinotarsa decemlineata]|uniref:retained isoform X3 n=1 Tax=Leptinotarsa decemlineata TaxID=7539 RepID=UPI003D304895